MYVHLLSYIVEIKDYSVLLVDRSKVTYIKMMVAFLIIHIFYNSKFHKSPVKNNKAGKDKWNKHSHTVPL